MKLPDSQFRVGVLIAAAVVVGMVTYIRFCGPLSLPNKPPPPAGPSGTQRQLLSKTAGSPGIYRDFLEQDAAAAGLRPPSIAEMSRKLSYRVDDARHVLELGRPAIEAAGLRLRVERSGDTVVMVIQNLVGSDVAYQVASSPSTGEYICSEARPLPINAMVLPKGGSETRTECAWRDGMSIAVTKVETLEVSPLSSYYLSHVPPRVVGIDDRIARGHRRTGTEACSAVVSQAVRTGMDHGQIGWRDLVDFYARHRCQTYQFPSIYRALTSDGERPIPATD